MFIDFQHEDEPLIEAGVDKGKNFVIKYLNTQL